MVDVKFDDLESRSAGSGWIEGQKKMRSLAVEPGDGSGGEDSLF